MNDKPIGERLGWTLLETTPKNVRTFQRSNVLTFTRRNLCLSNALI